MDFAGIDNGLEIDTHWHGGKVSFVPGFGSY